MRQAMSIVVFAIVAAVAHFVIVFLAWNDSENLKFSRNDHRKTIVANGFLNARETRAITPFVQFVAERISFVLQRTKLARC